MSDIELVIKIPKESYEQIIEAGDLDYLQVITAIENGIVLPEGHGDLIDADDIRVIELEDSLHVIRHEKGDGIDVYIDAPTIIEADKESEDEV